MSQELAALLAKKFIQRKDVKAVQVADGGYRPDRTPWKMRDLTDHVAGVRTLGHYVCDQESLCKVFVLDLDFEKSGTWVGGPGAENVPDGGVRYDLLDGAADVHESTPRADWRDRTHPGRSWYLHQLRTLVELLTTAIHGELGMQTVAAYSGNKGAHVYGFFPEPVEAIEARAAALIALEVAGGYLSADGTHKFEASKGANFFQFTDPSPVHGFKNLSIELFPKQASMEDKDLGNLCRLPLGKNLKNPNDTTFIIDQRAPYNKLVAHPDPVAALNAADPWLHS